jgi:hypothetical protein
MNSLILQFKKVAGLRLAVFALGCFAFSPHMQAATDTPDPGSVGPTNTADGESALPGATGFYNSGFGFLALLSNGAASFNTGVGAGALLINTGLENTAVGAGTLLSNTTAGNNTGCGAFALFTNSTGTNNVAVGDNALLFNGTGSRHTAVGSGALLNCVAAPDFEGNTAVGAEALRDDTTGNFNTAIGGSALKLNTIGIVNTAIGLDALVSNTEGNENTATGGNALFSNITGIQNTGNGTFALFSNETGDNNTAVGRNALVVSTGDGNTALGNDAGASVTTANNVICIGAGVVGANVDNTCFIGNISGVVVTGDPVVVDANGQLGVAPAGSPLSANELLKQQRVVQELKATTERQTAVIALQEGQIKALTAGLQKVSAQIELSKRAPQTVLNNH